MTIAAGTIVSSLQSDRLTRRFGTGRVTACSVAMTAAALLGFSFSRSFALLMVLAIPYGLGAGSVDASLNNYVALHYESRHMSWLHCMWGVGASISPYVMRYALASGRSWNMGYRYVGLLQAALTFILILSLPLWKNRPQQAGGGGKVRDAKTDGSEGAAAGRPLTIPQILRIPGAKELMLAFFCYCALEQTAGLWVSSYLVSRWGIAAETAAGLASLFFIGITAGRAASGFITMKLNDTQMIRLGMCIIAAGLILLFLPFHPLFAQAGFVLTWLGCAPVYPCIIHSTPAHFGAENSQAIIGVQMAFSYIGILAMPPLFGLLAGYFSTAILPMYLLLIFILMCLIHEKLVRKTGKDGRK
jgi:fucose permease